MSVDKASRFSRENPCPICGGCDDDKRGEGSRCFGFLSDDENWAHCTREDHGSGCKFNAKSNAYAHRLKGDCHCGKQHGPAEPRVTGNRGTKSIKGSGGKKKGDILGTIACTYPYKDIEGNLIFEVVRLKDPKGFRQRRPDPTGKKPWAWDLKGVEPFLYNLPALVASPNQTVVFVEGEKDVHFLQSIGCLATTSPMGAANWKDRYSDFLVGRNVVVIPDNDEPGSKYALQVARSLQGKGKGIKILELPDLGPGGDVSDWIQAGGTKEKLGELIKAAPVWQPTPEDESLSDSDQPKKIDRLEAFKLEMMAVIRSTSGFSLFYNSPDLLKKLAGIELNHGDFYASIMAEVRTIKGFSASDFKVAMRRHRDQAKAEDQERKTDERKLDRQIRNVKPLPEYRDQGSSIEMVTTDQNGQDRLETIAMFSAQIVENIIEDDGSPDTKGRLKIEARCSRESDIVRTAEIPSKSFEKMDWVIPFFGPDFLMLSGPGYRDNIRAAIQYFSLGCKRTVVYTHTGWRMIDEEWVYLHSKGAIGSRGNDPKVSVCVDGGNKPFDLPDPPSGANLRQALRASLGIFRLASDDRPGSSSVAAATFCAPYRAAIDYAKFSLQFYGGTGSFKSSTAALAQQHFGRLLNDEHFPANWSTDSPKSIASLANLIADACFVVDDFIPRGSSQQIAEKHDEAQGFFQSVGDHKGRQVLNPDRSRQPDRPPMCLPISTGEDRIKGGSADYRTFPIAFVAEDDAKDILGTIDPKVLSECQRDAESGLYAASMAGYLQWLAPQLDVVRAARPARLLELRDLLVRPGDHRRTPDIIADLLIGAETFLRFAVEVGAITQIERNQYFDLAYDGLCDAAEELRADRMDQSSPDDLFVRLIAASLASGLAYISDRNTDDCPDGLESVCGWRREHKNDRGTLVPTWDFWPNAMRIGWTDGEYLYLHPDNSYSVARKMATAQGDGFPVTKMMLHKTLLASKKVINEDSTCKDSKNRATGRVFVGTPRKQVRVLKMGCSLFWPTVMAETPDDAAANQAIEEVA